MSKESAMQFALAVMEDQELRERTAKLKPEEVLSIAKEMGFDFTEEELTAVMDENKELSADELETAAGGFWRPAAQTDARRTEQIDRIMKEKAEHCYGNIRGPRHKWVKTGHEERWMLWAWTRGYDLYTCSLCGAKAEEKV